MTFENNTQMAPFDDEDEGAKSAQLPPKPAEISSAAPKYAGLVATTTSPTDDTFSVSPLIKFVTTHQRRIWRHQKTRENNMARIKRFDAFDGYSDQLTKPALEIGT